MGNLPGPFEDFMMQLPDDEFEALQQRRTKHRDTSQPSHDAGQTLSGVKAKDGLDEARRRGYVKGK